MDVPAEVLEASEAAPVEGVPEEVSAAEADAPEVAAEDAREAVADADRITVIVPICSQRRSCRMKPCILAVVCLAY